MSGAMVWTTADIEILFDGLNTDDPIVTLDVTTPVGMMQVMATVLRRGRIVEVDGVHVQGLAANAIGAGGLLRVLRAILETIDADEIIIGGGIRTTGANPGHRPRIIRITRKLSPES